jgi:ABC-type glycerol-3-phosphate transport system substrate-binding protein
VAEIRGRLFGALALVAMLLDSSGCARPGAAPVDARGPITFVDGPDTSFGRQLHRLVEDWNERHGFAEQVTFIEMPFGTDEYRAQLRAHAQDLAHTYDSRYASQCYDVMEMDIIWTAEFAQSGYLVPLDGTEFGTDRFLKRPVEAVTLNGRLWAVPHRSDAGLLFYRKDLLDPEHFAPPATWAELWEQTRVIRSRHPVDGYLGQFRRYEGLTVNVLEAIWGNGGDVLTPNGTVVVDSPKASAGIAMLTDAVREGLIPPSALTFDEDHSREAFQRGSALFLRNWPYSYPSLADPDSPVAGKFGVAALPGPSALGGWNLGVSACSTHRQTARDFIRFLTSETAQRDLFITAGFAPTIAAIYSDPQLRAQFPYLEVLGRSIENSHNRPTSRYYDDISGIIQENLTTALTNPVSTEAMTTRLAQQLNAVLSQR